MGSVFFVLIVFFWFLYQKEPKGVREITSKYEREAEKLLRFSMVKGDIWSLLDVPDDPVTNPFERCTNRQQVTKVIRQILIEQAGRVRLAQAKGDYREEPHRSVYEEFYGAAKSFGINDSRKVHYDAAAKELWSYSI